MRARPSGFTLIELMISLAIIGLLSSVAIPSFRNMQLRSRQTERAILMQSIKKAIDDYHMREGRWPRDCGAGCSFMWGNVNPNANPGIAKRQMRLNMGDDWNRLSLLVQGNVYYSYAFQAWATPGMRQVFMEGYGDLDGDGTQDQVQRWYVYTGTRLAQWWGPQTCSDCSIEQRIPWNGAAF